MPFIIFSAGARNAEGTMALREINLVPENILSRTRLRQHLVFWSVCFGFVLVPICGFYLYQTSAALAQGQTKTHIKDVENHLLQGIEKIKHIQAELKSLNQQQADLEAKIRPPAYAGILFKLADTMSNHTWLKTLQIKRVGDPKNQALLQVTGYATSNAALGNFLNRLSGDPLIEGVVLKYAKEKSPETTSGTEEKTPNTIEFAFDCGILQG